MVTLGRKKQELMPHPPVRTAVPEVKDGMNMGRPEPQCVVNRNLLLKEIQDNENLERLRPRLEEAGIIHGPTIEFDPLKLLIRHWKLGSNKDRHFWRNHRTKWDLVDVLTAFFDVAAADKQRQIDRAGQKIERGRRQTRVQFYRQCVDEIHDGRNRPEDNLFLQSAPDIPALNLHPRKIPKLFRDGCTHLAGRDEQNTDVFMRGLIKQSRNFIGGVRLPVLSNESEMVCAPYNSALAAPHSAREAVQPAAESPRSSRQPPKTVRF